MVVQDNIDIGLEEISKARLRLWIKLLQTSRSIEIEVRERFRTKFDVTLPRFDVMAALFRQPDGMKMSQLSYSLMVSNGNVTGIVDRLVKDGLVIRSQPEGDRRSWIIKLTGNGTARFETMAAAHEAWINELLGNANSAQMETLQSQLTNLTDNQSPPDEDT